MRVVIFSDVQANLPAMEVAVERILRWGPDLVVLAGDLVNRGPRSLDCLNLFDELRRTRGWLPVQGNHEVFVLNCARTAPANPIEAALRRFTDWTAEQVRPRLEALLDWPDHLCFAPADGATGSTKGWVHVTHGTMKSNRDGIGPRTPDDSLRGRLPPDLGLFVTAHTHRPLDRVFDGTPVLNVGSVGSPFDGDPRGSYAQLEWRGGDWHRELIRFDYDRAQTDRDFRDSGFLDEGGPLAPILYEEWRQCRAMTPRWRRDFEPAVLAGARDLQEAVRDFFAQEGLSGP